MFQNEVKSEYIELFRLLLEVIAKDNLKYLSHIDCIENKKEILNGNAELKNALKDMKASDVKEIVMFCISLYLEVLESEK